MMKWLSDLIKKKSLIFVGAELTLLYFLFFGFICFHYVDYPKNLTLNELGDLLAGMFAPLAFMWMVITILMQGKELRLQREELSMQREELANSSAQLERQSNVMERQQTKEYLLAQEKEVKNNLLYFSRDLISIKLIDFDENFSNHDWGVLAPNFFEGDVFRIFLTKIDQKVESFNNVSKQIVGKQQAIEKFKVEIQKVIFSGERVVNSIKDNSVENIVLQTGFFDFLDNLKNTIKELNESKT